MPRDALTWGVDTPRKGPSLGPKPGQGSGEGPKPIQGLYKTLETRKDLIDIVTKTIFQSSVGHAAVNFLQFEYGCFAPNVPALLRGKIPKEEDRGNVTLDRIKESLPGLRPSLVQAGAAFTLSEFSEDEEFLLPLGPDCANLKKPPRYLFTVNTKERKYVNAEPEVDIAYNNFMRELQKLETKIKERRKSGKIPYEVLLPSQIPYGIAI